MHTDVMPAVGLSCRVHSNAGVAPGVGHLDVFYLQQPSFVQDLGPVLPRNGSSIFQPGDGWSGNALSCTLEGNVTSFCHSNIITDALAEFDGGTNCNERIESE